MKESTMVVTGVLLVAAIGLIALFFVVRKTPPSPAPPSPPSPAPPSPPSPAPPSPTPPSPAPSDEMIDCHAFSALSDHYKMSYSQVQKVLAEFGHNLSGGRTISKQNALDFFQKHGIKPSNTLNPWQFACCPINHPDVQMAWFFERGTIDPSEIC